MNSAEYYIGRQPDTFDIVISDDHNSNSSKLLASTKCVNNAVEEIKSSTSLPLGHIYLWPFSTPPDGSIQVNGSTYNRSLYSDLWTLIQEKGWYKSESEWQSIASANGGYCPWYSSGDGSTTFRTPKFAPYQKLALTSGDAGTYTAEGLPNITGEFTKNDIYYGYEDGTYSGALQSKEKVTYKNLGGGSGSDSGAHNSGWLIDASFSSPIYGSSEHVTPESNDWIVCVVAFGTATNVGSVDVANVMTAVGQVQADVATKLDSDTIHAIETWKSEDDSSWYRKYSDGWIEQGGVVGHVGLSGDTIIITLPTNFTSINYVVIAHGVSSTLKADSSTSGTKNTIMDYTRLCGSKTLTGFHIKFSSENNQNSTSWYACGY